MLALFAVLAAVVLVATLVLRNGDGGGGETGEVFAATTRQADAATTSGPGATTSAPVTTGPVTTGPVTSAPVTTAPAPPPTTTATTAPAANCPASAGPFVCLLRVDLDGAGNLVVPFEVRNFDPVIGAPPALHIHFYFDVEPMRSDPNAAGAAGQPPGSWILWDKPNPFGPGGPRAAYSLADARAVGAQQVCGLVANADHVVTPGTGNCVPIPA